MSGYISTALLSTLTPPVVWPNGLIFNPAIGSPNVSPFITDSYNPIIGSNDFGTIGLPL